MARTLMTQNKMFFIVMSSNIVGDKTSYKQEYICDIKNSVCIQMD